MKKKNVLILSILGILLALLLIASQQFSILGVSQISMGPDGKPQWTFYLRPSGEGEKMVFYSPNPSEMGSYSDSSGGKYVPQDDFYIAFYPHPTTCTYGLVENTDWRDSVNNWFKDIFGAEKVRYYGVAESFERSAPIDIKLSKTEKMQKIDGFNIGEMIMFNDDFDSKGALAVQAQGGLVGKFDCADTGGDLAISVGQDTGIIRYWYDKDARDDSFSRLSRDSWSSVYDVCEPSADKTRLICTKGYQSLGSGTVTVTADADYLDYQYYPPTEGEPQIVEVAAQAEVKQNTYGSVKVIAKNIGDSAGVFSITGSGGVSIFPSVTTVSLKPGEQMPVMFSVIGPMVNKDTAVAGKFEMCSLGQFSTPVCDSESFGMTVTVATPKSEYCGDKLCQVNENFNTCPQDCDQTPTCDGNHMEIQSGSCVCVEGYEMQEDALGRQFCEESVDLTMTLIILGFVFMFLAMIAVKMRMNKRR